MIVHVMKGERFMKLLRKRFVTEQQLTEMFKVLRQKPSEIRQQKLQKPKDKFKDILQSQPYYYHQQIWSSCHDERERMFACYLRYVRPKIGNGEKHLGKHGEYPKKVEKQ